MRTRIFPLPSPGWAALPAVCLVLAGTAVACGPFFPWQLLQDRPATMAKLPGDSFAARMRGLAPRPMPGLEAVVAGDDGAATGPAFEQRTLPPTQRALVERMRAQASGDLAFALGETLDPALRAYVAGAVAFLHGDRQGAAGYFRSVLDLPKRQGAARAVWAAFMLGRALPDLAASGQAFAQARSLAQAGAPDPLHLAVASFGETARLRLAEAGLAGDRGLAATLADAASHVPPGATLAALAQAARLYAQQAAYGDASGIESLRMIAEALLSGPQDLLTGAVRDDLLRRLLVAFAFCASSNGTATGFAGDDSQPVLLTDVDPAKVSATLLDRLASSFDAAGPGPGPGPGPGDAQERGAMAALAYARGRYDLAARFAGDAQDAEAAWVRAKLSLQRDDPDATARVYDAALRLARADPSGLPVDGAGRLQGEGGVLALSRGDFLAAMTMLFPLAGRYWGDVAYVAERVLTTEELRRFVDRADPAPAALVPAQAPTTDGAPPADPKTALRDLLARRLVRDGRLEDAQAYFSDPALRATLRRYGQALAQAHDAFWRTDRARAAWEAARIMRQDGMRIAGTEIAPDLAALDGAYAGGIGPDGRPAGRFVTPAEQARFDASRPRPDLRFHYRYVAADTVRRAADLLPPRSQAYAAVLCAGTHWMLESGSDAQARALYRLYVGNGALVAFGTHFGWSCPAPDFEGAARLRWHLPLLQGEAALRAHRQTAAAVLGLGALALAAILLARRGRA